MIELVRPSKGPKTQDYYNTQDNGEPHNGDDFGYTDGVNVFPDVYAAHDGVVEFVGDSRDLGWPNRYYMNPDFDRSDGVDSSAGNMICLFHPESLTRTMYSHLESWDVALGQQVRAGQRIAEKGATGNSRGKHLHFEVVESPISFNTPTYGRSCPVYTTPTVEDEIMGYYRDRADFEAHQLRIAKEAATAAVAAEVKASLPAIAKAVWDHMTMAPDGKTRTPMHRALRDPLNMLTSWGKSK